MQHTIAATLVGCGTNDYVVNSYGGLRIEEELLFERICTQHLCGAKVALCGRDYINACNAVAEKLCDEKLAGCAVVAAHANLGAIHHNALFGSTSLGVEENIPVAPHKWNIHLIAHNPLAGIVCPLAGLLILQVKVKPLCRAVALFGSVAGGVGDKFRAWFGNALGSVAIGALGHSGE